MSRQDTVLRSDVIFFRGRTFQTYSLRRLQDKYDLDEGKLHLIEIRDTNEQPAVVDHLIKFSGPVLIYTIRKKPGLDYLKLDFKDGLMVDSPELIDSDKALYDYSHLLKGASDLSPWDVIV